DSKAPILVPVGPSGREAAGSWRFGRSGGGRRSGGSRTPRDDAQAEAGPYWLRGTIRGSKVKRFGAFGPMRPRAQIGLRAPKVSSRVKFPSTPPCELLSGLSILK